MLISHKQHGEEDPPSAESNRESVEQRSHPPNEAARVVEQSGDGERARKHTPPPGPSSHHKGNIKIVPLMDASKPRAPQVIKSASLDVGRSDVERARKLTPPAVPSTHSKGNIKIVPLMDTKSSLNKSPSLDDTLLAAARNVPPKAGQYSSDKSRPKSGAMESTSKVWASSRSTALDGFEVPVSPTRSPSPLLGSSPHHRGNISIMPLMEPRRPVSPDDRRHARSPSPTRSPSPLLGSSPHHRGNISIVPLMVPKKKPLYSESASSRSLSPEPRRHGNIKIVEPQQQASFGFSPPAPSAFSQSGHSTNIPQPADIKTATSSESTSLPATRPTAAAKTPHRRGHVRIPSPNRYGESSLSDQQPKSGPKPPAAPQPPPLPAQDAAHSAAKPSIHVSPTGQPSPHQPSPRPPDKGMPGVKIVPMMAPRERTPVGSPLGRAPVNATSAKAAKHSDGKGEQGHAESVSSPLGPSIVSVDDRQNTIRGSSKGTAAPMGPIAISVDVFQEQGVAVGYLSMDRQGGLGPSPSDI